MRIALCIAASLLFHIVLGWEWSLLGGIFCGMMTAKNPGLWGGICVGSSWMILVAFNLIRAREAVLEMITVTGQIVGNLPGFVIVLLTVLIGSALGFVGALVGGKLVQLIPALKLYKEHQTVLR